MKKNNVFTMKIPALSTCILSLILLFTAMPAMAHKVSVFAWIEGEMINTQSKFMGGKPVKNAQVRVSGTNGAPLLEGRTDETGNFSFPIPEKAPLKIVVEAGMGHTGKWLVTAEDIADAFPQAAGTDFSAANDKTMHAPEPTAPTGKGMPTDTVTTEQIQQAVEKAVDAKLAPLINRLNRHLDNDRPDITEILSGIGYIFGLVGVAAYFNCRRKDKR